MGTSQFENSTKSDKKRVNSKFHKIVQNIVLNNKSENIAANKAIITNEAYT